MSIERLRQRHDLEVVWLPFPLHPEIPDEGVALAQLFAGQQAYVDSMLARLEERAAAEGLPFGDFDQIYNTRLAQELGKWADTQPGGERLHDVLFRAYFVEGENICDPATLVRLAVAAGLDESQAGQVLHTRSFGPQVDEDWDRARALQLSSVPTFIAAGRGVVGAQTYDVLEQLVRRAVEDGSVEDGRLRYLR